MEDMGITNRFGIYDCASQSLTAICVSDAWGSLSPTGLLKLVPKLGPDDSLHKDPDNEQEEDENPHDELL